MVVVAEYADMLRDQSVSSASSWGSWPRGVLGRVDLRVGLHKPRADGVANAAARRCFFYSAEKNKVGIRAQLCFQYVKWISRLFHFAFEVVPC